MTQPVNSATLPADTVFGRLEPRGPGPTRAEALEACDQDDDNPMELIGGWALPRSPGTFGAGRTNGNLYAVLLTLVTARGWDISVDALHRLPHPPNTVLYPDLAVHAIKDVAYLPGTETIGRVPELVVEVLGKKTCERDMGPRGAKFLAYQMSGVREYYYTWPDGMEAAGFTLDAGIYLPLPRCADGFFRSPLLGCEFRLVPAALR